MNTKTKKVLVVAAMGLALSAPLTQVHASFKLGDLTKVMPTIPVTIPVPVPTIPIPTPTDPIPHILPGGIFN